MHEGAEIIVSSSVSPAALTQRRSLAAQLLRVWGEDLGEPPPQNIVAVLTGGG